MIINRLLNKPSLLFTLLAVFIFLVFGVAGYFVFESKNSQQEQSKLLQKNQKLESEFQRLNQNHAKLQSDFSSMNKEFEELSRERDNLLRLAKSISVDTKRAQGLEESITIMGEDLERLKEEKDNLGQQNILLRERVATLQLSQKKLIEEKDRLSEELERVQAKEFVDNLKKEKEDLERRNKELISQVKKSQADYLKLKKETFQSEKGLDKTAAQAQELKQKLSELNSKYTKAVKNNRILERKIAQLPKKFSEIARQNKVLVKRTSNMHYNMGVFYTKQNKYGRAVAEFEKALELTPNDPYAHFNLGYIYEEHLVNRAKAIDHFRDYLRLVKKDDKDIDWVRKYILTWESFQGNKPID